MYTEEQINTWKEKAEKWDALAIKIGKFYEGWDEEKDEETAPEEEGDLGDIGLAAAAAFGYL